MAKQATTDKREQLQQLTEQLQRGVQEVFSSGKFADYLNTMSRFHTYSFRNTMAIYMQNPNATRVAGFNTWKRLGRSVNKGEKGLQILAPTPYKRKIEETHDKYGNMLPEPKISEIEVISFKLSYVFDVSQTNSRELPEIAHRLTGEVGEYDILMNALREISPYPISFEPIERASANGYCDYTNERIVICEGLSQEQTVKTAIHEIAHGMMHTPQADETRDKRAQEIQAESVAYIVCQRLGVDSSEYSFGYVAGWAADKDLKALEGSLDAIRNGAKQIICTLEPEMERQRELIQNREASYQLENGSLLYLQPSEQGYDYTVYAKSGLMLDGGQLDAPGLLPQEAAQEIASTCVKHLDLAERIDSFFSAYEPAYGYSAEISGWENRERAIESINNMLQSGKTEWLTEAFNTIHRDPQLQEYITVLEQAVQRFTDTQAVSPVLEAAKEQQLTLASDHITVEGHTDTSSNLKAFIEQHCNESIQIMTPGGYVSLNPENIQLLINGKSIMAHPGCSNNSMEIDAKDLLSQCVIAANYNGNQWWVLSGNINESPFTEALPSQLEKNQLTLASDHISVGGHKGTWYAIDQVSIEGKDYFLLEHETYGDTAPCVVVTDEGILAMENVHNGFDDFKEQLVGRGVERVAAEILKAEKPHTIKERLTALKPECDRINAEHAANRSAPDRNDRGR